MAISVGDAVLTITGDSADLDRELSKVNGKVKGISSSMAKNMKIAGAAMTGTGLAITAALGFAVKGAMDFETAMREVNTMMGQSGEEFDAFSKDVQALAADMGVDAVESAKALYQAISAGVPKENVLEFLEIATKAAIGGVTETETAVDGLTTVINAFKLPMSDAQKVADLMFTTVKGGKTTFDELSNSLFNVAPIAAASGVSFEEVSAALATMTKQGVPTAQATTQIRQAMVALQKPTADMNKIIEELGYESGQTMLAELGLAKTLNVLRDATAGNNEMLMKMFGSVEAGQAVLALTGENAQMFAADLDAMANAAGASQAAFEEMENSTSRQMEKLKNSLKSVGISIGNVLIPVLKDMLEKVKPIIDKIVEWIQKNPGLTKVIVIAAAALGGLLLVLGPLLMVMPGIIALLPFLSGGFIGLGAAMAFATGPIGLIILAIAALIAIGILVWKNWDTIALKAKEIFWTVAVFFQKIWYKIEGIFKKHWDKILAILFPAIGLPILIARNWGKIKDAMVAPFRAAAKGIENAINWIISMLNKVSFTIPDWVPGLGGKHYGINIPPVKLPSFKDFEGIIPGIPGTPIPAIVHAGERISQGGDTVITGNNFYIREEEDINKVARQLFNLQRTKARQHGI